MNWTDNKLCLKYFKIQIPCVSSDVKNQLGRFLLLLDYGRNLSYSSVWTESKQSI